MAASFSNLSLEEIAGRDFICECGNRHSTGVKVIKIGAGVLSELPDIVSCQHLSSGRVFDRVRDSILLVEDKNTEAAAGKYILSLLCNFGYHVDILRFESDELVAKIEEVERIETQIAPDTALLIAVGAGTLNDITKYAAHRHNLPFYIVCTAPSMDGYASSVAPMIINGVKYALEAKCPEVIIGDIDIISRAPLRLMSAGYGDIAGKCVSICDWKLSSIVTGEVFCEKIAETVLETVRKCNDNIEGLMKRDADATQAVTEALVLCGLMMSYAKTSRPASGSEHNFGHIVEMNQLFWGEVPSLHGEGVAVGSVLSCLLLRSLLDTVPDRTLAERAIAAWDENFWQMEIKRLCPVGWEDIIKIEEKNRKNKPDTIRQRLDIIISKWHEICLIIEKYIPDSEKIAADLQAAGAPVTPCALGLDEARFRDAMRYARDMRYRYSVLQLIHDIGLDDYFNDIAVKYFASQKK